jgi:hypothetical protein
MQTIFNQFKEQFKGKSLNEILGCAKYHCEGLHLVKDVDEYDNNEFAFVVGWYPNDEYNPNERIEVECLYSHLTGDAEFTLLTKEVTKFGRTWEIVSKLDLKEESYGSPIWWEVLKMEDGVLWMNNYDGIMAFIENNGRILKVHF